MKEQRLKQWIENFKQEIKFVEVEFNSFFKKTNLQEFYKINIDNTIGFISIELISREQLPIEIIDAITVALLRSKPRFKLTE